MYHMEVCTFCIKMALRSQLHISFDSIGLVESNLNSVFRVAQSASEMFVQNYVCSEISTDWLTDWLTDGQTKWLTNWLADMFSDNG